MPASPLPARCSMLLRLATERATGALLREAGTLYLADGRVVHAESAAAPGVDVLLTASGRLPRAAWDEMVARGDEMVARVGPHPTASHLLADGGPLTPGELELCLLTSLFDAAHFALAPCRGPARFQKGLVHRLGTVCAVPAELVEAECRRRRRLLDALWPGPAIDTQPLVRRRPAPGQTVPRHQSALLEFADGTHTPADISRLLGRPAFRVLLDVRRLAVAGLIAPPGPPSGATPGRSPGPLPRTAQRTAQRTAPTTAPRPSPDDRPWAPDGFAEPDTALLRRLRSALEAL
ncbi:transcriptional regulator [Streptomyces sp. E11-3]